MKAIKAAEGLPKDWDSRIDRPGRGLLLAGGTTLLLAVSALTGLFPTNLMRYLMQIFLYITLGEAWNLLSGFAGLTSLGQQLYVGLAGYTVAVVTGLLRGSMSAAVLAAALVAVLAAVPVSFLLFRMRGMYFAVATWVVAEAAEKLFLNWTYVGQGSGMTVRLNPYPSVRTLYLLSLVVCVLTMLLIGALMRSKNGMGLMAMRDDPTAAASIGISITGMRLTACVLSALLSGLAGALFFLNKGTIYPESGFAVSWTVSAVFICIMGGTGTIGGPVAGAVIYVLLREYLAHYPGWSNIMLGVITLAVIFFLPDGIVGTIQSRFISDGPKRDKMRMRSGYNV